MVSELAQQRSAEGCARRRIERWESFAAEADREWDALSKEPEFMFGLALYVGEGNKAGNERLSVANCDPGVLRSTIRFFLRYLGADLSDIRAHINLHDDGDAEAAELYWQRQLGLSARQFYRTVLATARSSGRKRTGVRPFGTCHVTIYSTRLKQKVNRWMELALKEGL